LPEERAIDTGSLRDVHFSRGYYAYVGSALGGLKSRLSRHFRSDKKLHWHIDYLLQKASIIDVIIGETESKVECALAQALSSQFDSIRGFGSSDCHCRSHLFFAAEGRRIESATRTALESLTMPPGLTG
jgi:sugar fermentation stimulation protein A